MMTMTTKNKICMASCAWQLIEQTKRQKISNIYNFRFKLRITRNSDQNIYSTNNTHYFLVISLSVIIYMYI